MPPLQSSQVSILVANTRTTLVNFRLWHSLMSGKLDSGREGQGENMLASSFRRLHTDGLPGEDMFPEFLSVSPGSQFSRIL